MDGFVKVTLTAPYTFGRDGASLPIIMPYGYTEPRVTLAQDAYGRDVSRTVPGKRITYVLDWDNVAKRSVIMPEGAARLYFGHWDLPEVQDENSPDVLQIAAGLTTDTERKRVADQWGGYTHAKLDSDNKKNFLLPIIDSPKVPHVVVGPVNEAGDETDFAFEPWARYKWAEYVTPLDQLPPSMQLPPGYINPNSAKAMQAPQAVQGYSHADMLKIVADAVAAALDKATAPQRKAV